MSFLGKERFAFTLNITLLVQELEGCEGEDDDDYDCTYVMWIVMRKGMEQKEHYTEQHCEGVRNDCVAHPYDK